MNTEKIKRYVNVRTGILYFAIISLLIYTRGFSSDFSLVNLIGGFDNKKGIFGINLYEIICWNICVLPPVVISVLYAMEEFGPLSIFTMIRSKNIRKWYDSRFYAILLINIMYLFSVILISSIFRIYTGSGIENMSRLIPMFLLHTTMVSVVSVTILAKSRNVNAVIIFFALLEICGAVVVSKSTLVSKYMIVSWGMFKNTDYFFDNSNLHLIIISLVTIAIIVICYCITLLSLKKKNPTTSSQS